VFARMCQAIEAGLGIRDYGCTCRPPGSCRTSTWVRPRLFVEQGVRLAVGFMGGRPGRGRLRPMLAIRIHAASVPRVEGSEGFPWPRGILPLYIIVTSSPRIVGLVLLCRCAGSGSQRIEGGRPVPSLGSHGRGERRRRLRQVGRRRGPARRPPRPRPGKEIVKLQ